MVMVLYESTEAKQGGEEEISQNGTAGARSRHDSKRAETVDVTQLVDEDDNMFC